MRAHDAEPEAGPAAALARELSRAVADPRVLNAIATVPREVFVPRRLRSQAYRNMPLPIGCGQTISQPFVVARMCELLCLEPTDRVLEVGTGSGYHAAVLAQLCAHVWTIERHEELSRRAEQSLLAAGIENVTLIVGDGSLGYPDAAPYDAISIAAAARSEVPPALVEQLAPGGRLIAPVSERDQRLVLLERGALGVERHDYERVRFVPLVET